MAQAENVNRPYPREFESGLMGVGSLTIDSGHEFRISVDEDGFHVTRELGTIGVGDLFGEMGYWPERVAWKGSAATLGALLEPLAKAADLTLDDLTTLIVEHCEANLEQDMRAYLEAEKRAGGRIDDLRALWSKWPDLAGTNQVPGLPSPDIGPECCYNGVELELGETGWTARLCITPPDDIPEMFCPETWDADTFDGLFEAQGRDTALGDVLPWTRDELAAVLVEDDPRWRPFVESGEAGTTEQK